MIGENELTIEKRPLYLYVCVQGPAVTGSVVRHFLSEILEVFRTAQYSRLLIKNETPTALDGEILNYLADEIVNQGSQGLKIAIVDELPDNENRDRRGDGRDWGTGLDVAFFNSFAAAVHWLLYG